jgi:putative serine protease PepD
MAAHPPPVSPWIDRAHPYASPRPGGTDPSLLTASPRPGGTDPSLVTGPPRRRRWSRLVLVVVLVALLATCAGLVVEVRDLQGELAAQRLGAAEAARLADERLAAGAAATNGLAERLGALEAKVGDQPDLPKVASAVQPSVFTVRTRNGLGSGFVLRSAGGRSTLVTNFHVVEEAWATPKREVAVANEGRDLVGVVTRVLEAQDLALVDVDVELPVLAKATTQPKVGDPVLAIGSPLGLAGSASSGIVSAVRPGSLQFSAPVSPGNSGGPVVDRRGEVLGVTTSKLVASGAEGLSFAIPVDTVCSSLQVC